MMFVIFLGIINHDVREVEATKSTSAKSNTLQQPSLTVPDPPAQAEKTQTSPSTWLSRFGLWAWKRSAGPTATGSKESEGSPAASSDETKGKR